jgi:type II secretory pathway component PulF
VPSKRAIFSGGVDRSRGDWTRELVECSEDGLFPRLSINEWSIGAGSGIFMENLSKIAHELRRLFAARIATSNLFFTSLSISILGTILSIYS